MKTTCPFLFYSLCGLRPMMNIPTISEMDIVHIRPPDFEENWGGGNYAYRREWIMGIYARPTTGAAAPTTVHFCLIPFQTEMARGGYTSVTSVLPFVQQDFLENTRSFRHYSLSREV
jgi:hypothetical protein